MNQEKIGKFISKCRKEKNMTQEELAEKLNVNVKSISRWENGKNMPDYSVIEILCDTLDINVNELLNGEKENVNTNEITLKNVEIIQKQKNKMNQGIVLLGCAFSTIIATIIFAKNDPMAVIFGGITIGYLLAGMITLFRR